MTDWAKVLCDIYRDEDRPGDKPDTAEFEAVDVPRVSAGGVKESSRPVVKVPRVNPVAVGVGVLVAVGGIAGGGLIAVGMRGTAAQPVPVADVGGSWCVDAPVADRTNPEGVVVAFQRAYFMGDVAGVEATLAANSPLRETAWDVVLPDQEQDICVDVLEASSVDVVAKTTVRDEDNAQFVVYEQVFSLFNSEAGPRIVTISDREGS